MEYDDGLIACGDDRLLIRRYGLLLRSKPIPYTQIRAVTKVGVGMIFQRWRIWGSTDLRHWFNFDWGRRHKDVGLVLDLGERVKPVITPDDPERVVAILRHHGVAGDSARSAP